MNSGKQTEKSLCYFA